MSETLQSFLFLLNRGKPFTTNTGSSEQTNLDESQMSEMYEWINKEQIIQDVYLVPCATDVHMCNYQAFVREV